MTRSVARVGLMMFVLLLAAFAVSSWAQTTTRPQTRPQNPPAPTQTRPAQTKPATTTTAKTAYVLMTTSKGDIVIELNHDKAPISVDNFLSYVNKKFYDGTIFHRVIPNFMIQGGGFTADMKEKTADKPIKNEWRNGLKNTRGTLAMARLGNQPDSASSQFFINVQDNAFLDQPRDGAGYAVFAKVVAGMKVVDAIKVVPTTTKGPNGDVPVEPVTIQKVTVIMPDQAQKMIDAEKPQPN